MWVWVKCVELFFDGVFDGRGSSDIELGFVYAALCALYVTLHARERIALSEVISQP